VKSLLAVLRMDSGFKAVTDARNVKQGNSMTESENAGVNQDVADPVAEDMGVAHAEPEQVEATQEVQETDQEMNFRKLRESNEQLQREREKDALEREKDRQMMMALQQELLKRGEAPTPTPVEEVDEFASIASDEWLTKAQSERLAAKIAAEVARKAVEEDRAKRHVEEAPNRIKNRFQDFDAVVTEENVKQLRALEPDVAQALSLIGDEEAKAVAAYKYIKAFVPQAAETTAAKQRIQDNANQPKSLSATGGTSPLSKAGAFEQGLTPSLKKQLFAEMQSAARQS